MYSAVLWCTQTHCTLQHSPTFLSCTNYKLYLCRPRKHKHHPFCCPECVFLAARSALLSMAICMRVPIVGVLKHCLLWNKPWQLYTSNLPWSPLCLISLPVPSTTAHHHNINQSLLGDPHLAAWLGTWFHMWKVFHFNAAISLAPQSSLMWHWGRQNQCF